MIRRPLDHAEVGAEILEILEGGVDRDGWFFATFVYGPFPRNEAAALITVKATIPCPVKVEIINDESSDRSFDTPGQGFERVSQTVPGVSVSTTSNRLRAFLDAEPWVNLVYGDDLTHTVIWSYGGGVMHVFSEHAPKLEVI